MATVVTSIGSNSSIDTETPSSCSGSFSPYTVTFGTTPTGVNIGDKVEIEDQSSYYSTFTYRVTGISGTSYTLAYVTDTAAWGDVSPCDLLDFSWGQAPATFKRFYSSITNWEAGLDDSDVYASSDDAVGECHNDSIFRESVTINGGATVGLASVKLSVHSGSRHDGTAGTGARMQPWSTPYGTGIVDISRDDVTVEWLEISGESATAYAMFGVNILSGADENIYIRNNIIHDMNDALSFSSGVRIATAGTSRYVMNNFIYNIARSSGGVVGINTTVASTAAEIYCNTIFNISTGAGSANGIYVNDSTPVVKDNISLEMDGATTQACFKILTGSANAASDYNLSDDTTAWGSNSVTSSDGATAANTIADTTSGSEDLHLKSGSLALQAGVDLGTTPTGVEIDIDGRDRDAEGDTWDIGADQAVGLSVSITPAAASFELAGISPSVAQSSLTITVAVAAFALAGVSPTVSITVPLVIVPTAAAFELSGVSPSVLTGSVTTSPAAAAFELAGVSPTVVIYVPLVIEPAAATFELTAVSPSVIVPVIITPAAASFELAGITPTAVAGSLSLTPSVTAIEFAGVSPSVTLASLTVAPAASAVEFVGITPTTTAASLSITPAVAALELAGISPSVTRGSISVTPAAAITKYSARYGSLILGGIVVIPVQEAGFVYTAVDPAVGMSSQTVAVTASAFELAGVTPSTINGSIILAPAASVVEFAASVETIHAGVEVPPAAAAFDYVVGSFTLRVEMDSASLGYSCDGLNDYIGGTLPTDYSIGKNLDYRYDHQS